MRGRLLNTLAFLQVLSRIGFGGIAFNPPGLQFSDQGFRQMNVLRGAVLQNSLHHGRVNLPQLPFRIDVHENKH